MNKVYVVLKDEAYEYELSTTVEMFSTKEKARDYFNECVADFKTSQPDWQDDNYIVEEDDNSFMWCDEGRYIETHYDISIIEKEIK